MLEEVDDAMKIRLTKTIIPDTPERNRNDSDGTGIMGSDEGGEDDKLDEKTKKKRKNLKLKMTHNHDII